MLMTTLKFQATFGRTVEVDKPYNPYFHEEENNNQRVGLPGLEDQEGAEQIVEFHYVVFYPLERDF